MNIPFAGPLGPTNGVDSDGCLHSELTYSKPNYAYTSSYAEPITKAIRGNADDAGGVLYEDVSVALGAANGSYATLFDTANPTEDEVWIELGATEEIEGVGIYVSTAGEYTGTEECSLTYKSAAGSWVDIPCTMTGALSSTGMTYISFDKISGASLAVMDALIDPVNGDQARRFLLKFSGISAVTVSPVVDMVFKMFPSDGTAKLTDGDAYCVADVADLPDAYDALSVFAHVGDRTMFAFTERLAMLKITVERARITPDAKLVYSKADGTFGDLTVLSMGTASDARPGQWLTVDPGASPVEYTDIIVPPSDWGVQTFDLGEEYPHTGYWIGIEYTAGSAQPDLAFLAAFKGALFSGTNGVTASETIANATITLNVRSASDTESIFVVANLTTGNSVLLTLGADDTSAQATSTLAVTKGDRLAIQQLTGSEISVPSDGFFAIN